MKEDAKINSLQNLKGGIHVDKLAEAVKDYLSGNYQKLVEEDNCNLMSGQVSLTSIPDHKGMVSQEKLLLDEASLEMTPSVLKES